MASKVDAGVVSCRTGQGETVWAYLGCNTSKGWEVGGGWTCGSGWRNGMTDGWGGPG